MKTRTVVFVVVIAALLALIVYVFRAQLVIFLAFGTFGVIVIGVRALINRASMSLLQKAAARGDAAACSLLIARGAPVDKASAFGDTPLIFASRAGSVETVKLLLSHGASVDARGTGGRTPLIASVRRSSTGNLAVTKELLAHGPQLEARDRDHLTPLMHAVDRRNLEAVRLLIQAGANVNATVTAPSTNNSPMTYRSLLRRAPLGSEIRQALLEAGATESFDEAFGRF